MLCLHSTRSCHGGFGSFILLSCCLQDACTNQPRLRRNAAVLARDIAAVCTGLRAAVMVDYMPLRSSTMLAILADTQAHTAAPQQCKPVFPSCLLHSSYTRVIVAFMCLCKQADAATIAVATVSLPAPNQAFSCCMVHWCCSQSMGSLASISVLSATYKTDSSTDSL